MKQLIFCIKYRKYIIWQGKKAVKLKIVSGYEKGSIRRLD